VRTAPLFVDFVERTRQGQEIARERYGPLLNLVFPPSGTEFRLRAGRHTLLIHDVPLELPDGARCIAEVLEAASPQKIEEIEVIAGPDGRPRGYLKSTFAA
jgi:hypothetical protein